MHYTLPRSPTAVTSKSHTAGRCLLYYKQHIDRHLFDTHSTAAKFNLGISISIRGGGDEGMRASGVQR